MRERLSTRQIDEALAEAVRLRELGVQVTLYLGEERIVDTWTSPPDPRTGREYDDRTLYPIFSVTKAVSATALHIQAKRGLVDYEAPVARYWPEFARNGKEAITVRHVLTHQSGVSQMRDAVTPGLMGDWGWMVSQLAEAVPVAKPGASSAYHSLNYGWLIGEVVRRSDGGHRSFNAFVREELCAPLGIEDLWIGLSENEFGRVARLYSQMSEARVPGKSAISREAKPFPVQPVASVQNDPVVWAGSLPGAGGIGTAAAVARIFAILANGGHLDGVRLLSEERARFFTHPHPNPHFLDLVLAGGVAVPNIGMGGYWLEDRNPGTSASFLCHSGAGRSLAFADLDTRLAGMIAHNRMFEPTELGLDPWGALGSAILDIGTQQRAIAAADAVF